MAITTLVTARTELQARGYNRFTSGRLDAWLAAAARGTMRDTNCPGGA